MNPKDLDAFIPRLSEPMTPKDFRVLSNSRWPWKEAVLQERWQAYVIPTQEHVLNIMRTADLLTRIELILNGPKVDILSWYRVPQYNKLVGGAPKSYHTEGLAIDFAVQGMSADKARELLRPKLDVLNCRLQNHPKGTTWLHVDLGAVGPSGRFFK